MSRARRELLDRRRGAAWGYRRDARPGPEPTALASLGLLGTGDPASASADRATTRGSAEWMAGLQRSDGSIPATSDPAMPGWATPYAILLWGGLGGFSSERERARRWLLDQAGRPIPVTPETRAVLGHDPTLIGWPWVAGTHSWLEPTALAVLALCREGLGDHPRVGQGLRLILDREIPSGGWNYGNSAVFGRTLRPQPGPTGLALLALAARQVQTPAVARARDYLLGTLPGLRSGVSLGWGLLGLRAHDARPTQADSWLAEAYERSTGRPDTTLDLAALLLAAGEAALGLLLPGSGGSNPDQGPRSH
jgi:hypothetical protein